MRGEEGGGRVGDGGRERGEGVKGTSILAGRVLGN